MHPSCDLLGLHWSGHSLGSSLVAGVHSAKLKGEVPQQALVLFPVLCSLMLHYFWRQKLKAWGLGGERWMYE